jgi:hypothetical protein
MRRIIALEAEVLAHAGLEVSEGRHSRL